LQADSPWQDGAAKDCTAYEDVDESMTCKDALDDADLTIAQFYALNPAIGADCANLWTGEIFSPDTLDI
jgi:hypothetical protein